MTKLRDFLLPLAEPGCRSWRLRWSEPQLLGQQNQIVRDVDVVDGFGAARCKFKDLNAGQQSVKRAPCSHTSAFEERRVSGLGANQIVASIVGWPDHYVVRGEYLERAVQNRRRKVWTVAIEGDDVPLPGGSKVSKNRGESRGETFAFLRHDRHAIA